MVDPEEDMNEGVGASFGPGSSPPDQAPAGLDAPRVDPSRIAALESIIRDTLWMACRYAHGRQSYSVGMYNDAARRALALGVVAQGCETFAIDGSLTREMSGLTPQEFATAWHNWSSPDAIFTHIPRRDRDGSGEASETGTGSTEGNSPGLQGIAR
jgi:hypothetical protein